jgi:hypothetical protein
MLNHLLTYLVEKPINHCHAKCKIEIGRIAREKSKGGDLQIEK